MPFRKTSRDNAAKIFFWRSIFSELYQEIFVTVTSMMAENDILRFPEKT